MKDKIKELIEKYENMGVMMYTQLSSYDVAKDLETLLTECDHKNKCGRTQSEYHHTYDDTLCGQKTVSTYHDKYCTYCGREIEDKK